MINELPIKVAKLINFLLMRILCIHRIFNVVGCQHFDLGHELLVAMLLLEFQVLLEQGSHFFHGNSL